MKIAKNHFTPDQIKAAEKDFKARNKLKASGFAGLNKRGRLVDRRIDPSATPCRQNKFLGFGIPKTEDELKAALSK